MSILKLSFADVAFPSPSVCITVLSVQPHSAVVMAAIMIAMLVIIFIIPCNYTVANFDKILVVHVTINAAIAYNFTDSSPRLFRRAIETVCRFAAWKVGGMGVPRMFCGCGPPVLIGFSVKVNASKRHACLPAICSYHCLNAIKACSASCLCFPLHGPAHSVPWLRSVQSLSLWSPLGMRFSVCVLFPTARCLHVCRKVLLSCLASGVFL